MPRRIPTTFDVIVIGGGSAGIAAADVARQNGARVCMIEADRLGGECPNWACVPTKAMLRAAMLYDEIRHAAPEAGIRTGDVQFHFGRLMARKDAVVDAVTGHGKRLAAWAKANDIEVVRGDAAFADPHAIRVGTMKLRARAFVIATGSVDAIPPIAGIEDVDYATSRDVVSLKTLPDRIAVIGGGPVGMEFATFFSLLRRKVTLIEAGKAVLPREDAEVAALAAAALRGHGAAVYEHAKVLAVRRKGKTTEITFQRGTKRRETLRADLLLVATGKRPNVAHLGLDVAGVRRDDRGRLVLNRNLQTSVPHIYAAGDVTSGYLFTHTAHAEGAFVGALAAGAPAPRTTKPLLPVVPRVTFVVPEVASVGMTEAAARKAGKKVAVARFPIGALSRAVIDDTRDGLVKVVMETRTGKILGAHIIGSRAGECIHELALAIHAGIPFDEVAAMLHAFPTYSEGIAAAAGSL
ncbi:NAD(P)/FAD-dependent oxidoreductase [Candidatus Uhrbacteria bacterium]|nr:NAD(P)/FAD-dependent oxidoreductase [Candidatus Uhrbacteria bacterium]